MVTIQNDGNPENTAFTGRTITLDKIAHSYSNLAV